MKLKRISLAAGLLLCCLIQPAAKAQTAQPEATGHKKHGLSIRVGTLSSNRMINSLNDFSEKAFGPVISSMFTGQYTKTEITNRRNTPAVSLAYFYNINKWFSLGSTATFESTSAKFKVEDAYVGSFNRHYLTAAAEATCGYNLGEKIEFYGLLGLGYTFSKPYTNIPPEWESRFLTRRIHPNIQFTPLAVRSAVNEKIRFAFEVGFGYKGLLNAGLDYCF
ncbi:hypothetical protein I5M27_03955 [Adhaeribacter sp. BT258]|uniref:Outer membrane protein beta-barrel domain-containing protein n=1 Tax=Adhaeribacter terrigena TaxID=2793070 RepID=A0ABS1BY96_9BACT|nr:hypothetical protein [Adhaeribacter terrigena]MBK0402124.1 hypothetical protein [Adhaeribacter terrigena]